jgi:hypothetical protein
VTTSGGNQVIANRLENGDFRWAVGETVVYVSEGSILPDEILKDRGYWDEEKDRGLLDGGKRNRVKMKRLAGFESRGLLFKCHNPRADWSSDTETDLEVVGFVSNPHLNVDDISVHWEPVKMGQDVSEFFGITEFAG